MPDEIHYELLDVFTSTPFAGNPLAVCVDPPSLDDAQMQTVASELNLSETVFVSTPADPGAPWPTRIFTPAHELPFAGHPTIGAALLLAGRHRELDTVVLGERVGDVAVAIERHADGHAAKAHLTTATLPERVGAAPREAVAAALSLHVDDLLAGAEVAGWSCGVGFTMAAVNDLDALGRARPDLARWEASVAGTDAQDLYVLAPGERTGEWRCRMFGPGVGIVEDPATGSAAAATAGWLVDHHRPGDGVTTWVLHQGFEMGRPSRIELSVTVEGGAPVAVRVGGTAVVIGGGHLAVPVRR